MKPLQLHKLHRTSNALHKTFGDANYCSINGAGCTEKPRCMFVFMNPTAANVSARKSWRSLRAPWIGTKTVWKLFHAIGGISDKTYQATQCMQAHAWTPVFAKQIYRELAHKKFYITNLAKCTQPDARPLSNHVFKQYMPLFRQETLHVRPRAIIAFGNQVSSILLEKQIRVGDYRTNAHELIKTKRKEFRVYPTYYPVGQGMRNMPKAIARIKNILAI